MPAEKVARESANAKNDALCLVRGWQADAVTTRSDNTRQRVANKRFINDPVFGDGSCLDLIVEAFVNERRRDRRTVRIGASLPAHLDLPARSHCLPHVIDHG
jgi:hypothetical protein